MKDKNILFISQEITPYLPESHMANIGRHLPQAIQEEGNEVRVFMPRFGSVNERRNKLHEVIRLSGMNLIINDLDHSLIIKVASIQSARMQVYFIDNEEYFKRKSTVNNKEGKYYDDNDERMIFFGRGALETVKKLRWTPDLVHCQGWMSALVPLFIKSIYQHDPLFENAKVIYSIYNDAFDNEFDETFKAKVKIDGLTDEHLTGFDKLNYIELTKLALKYSDGIVLAEEAIDESILKIAESSGLPIMTHKQSEEYVADYSSFFEGILAV